MSDSTGSVTDPVDLQKANKQISAKWHVTMLNQVLQADKDRTHTVYHWPTVQNTDADYKGYACVSPSLCKCSGHDSLSGHVNPQGEFFSEMHLRSGLNM